MNRKTLLLAGLVVVFAGAIWFQRSHLEHGVHGHFSIGGATAAEIEASLATAPFTVVEVARVAGPTAIAEPPGGPVGLWIAGQSGLLHRLSTSGTLTALDIRKRVTSGGELGLLGMAFHPKWPDDPRVFLNYTTEGPSGLRSIVASFRTNDGGLTVNPDTEVLVITYDQPYSNHNSGSMQFGPDGMLYVAVGDGGSGGDPKKTGQNRQDLLGSILRLDVTTAPYTVPPDNPFVGEAGVRGEIWAYGLRNPWGMHFDAETLWFSDVGQNAYEEVNRGVRGGNYGWNHKEGTHCYERPTCAGNYIEPMAEYDRQSGTSVTGGVVFRNSLFPSLDGKFVFADFTTGLFFAVPAAGGKLERLVESKIHPSTFGRDRNGAVYVSDYGSGAILRMDPPAP